MTTADGEAAATLSSAERTRLHVMLGAVALLVIGSLVGQALSPTLVNDAPLLLILLNPRNSFLLLVSHTVELWAFVAVGFLRAQGAGSLDSVLSWLDRWFPRIGPVLVFVAPNTWVCLLAGISRMRIGLFVVLNVTGTLTRLALVWWLGDVFRDQLESILDFVARYQWPATAVMVGLVVVQTMLSRRRGSGELGQLNRLEDEITGEE